MSLQNTASNNSRISLLGQLRIGFLLLSMMAFCTALSIFVFGTQSLRLDEAQSLWQSGRGPLQIFTVIAQDVHVPLYHLLLHFWRLFLGDTVEIARSLSLLFYLISIPALYILGKLAYSRSVGLFAALLLALSPFMNWYASEIRMYMLFTFLVIVNQYFFIRILKRTDSDHVWIGYAITAFLGVYTHYFFFLNLLSQALFYFLRKDEFPSYALRRLITVAILVVIGFAPWLWYVATLGTAGYQDPLLASPTTVNLFSTFSQFLFGFQSDHLNAFFLSLWPFALILGFLKLRKNARLEPQTEYLMISVFASTAAAFAVSFIVPVFVSRYLIFTIPSLYILLASVIVSYPPRFARFVGITLLILMTATLANEIRNPMTPVKEDYRGAVTYLNENVGPQDIIILSAPFTIYPVEYYYRGPAPLATLPEWNRYEFGAIPTFSEAELPEEVSSITEGYQNVWLLLSYDQGYEENIRLYFDNTYERLFVRNFSPELNLYVYRLRYDTLLSQL